MTNLPNTISRAYLNTKGEHGVGIPGESATVGADGDFLLDLECLAEEDRMPVLEEFRLKLADAFAVIWDEPATVRFDFELASLS